LVLEGIVQDYDFLLELLNLYELKAHNDIFTENKKNIQLALKAMH
jgi:hypothetical protein